MDKHRKLEALGQRLTSLVLQAYGFPACEQEIEVEIRKGLWHACRWEKDGELVEVLFTNWQFRYSHPEDRSGVVRFTNVKTKDRQIHAFLLLCFQYHHVHQHGSDKPMILPPPPPWLIPPP